MRQVNILEHQQKLIVTKTINFENNREKIYKKLIFFLNHVLSNLVCVALVVDEVRRLRPHRPVEETVLVHVTTLTHHFKAVEVLTVHKYIGLKGQWCM